VPAGTGVLLNDEMDDFVAKPGTANVYGLVGGEANAIAPGKRMLSSMSPTFLRNDNRLAILGTPGGSRIISMVLLATLAFAENMEANQIVSLPRYHHQYLPDEIQFEKNSFTADELKQLAAKGHALKLLDDTYGNMQIIMWDKKNNHIRAASDPRGIGSAHVDKKVTH